MKKQVAILAAAVALTSTGGAVHAQFLMDGKKDAAYVELSVQDTQTQFGDGTFTDPIYSNGSEIDGVYGKVYQGRLYLMITGNLQSNFDKLEIFIDSEQGQGINTFNTSNYIEDPGTSNPRDDWHNLNTLPGGVDGFCCGGFAPPDGGNTENEGALQRMHGLTFDAGFNADHYITISHGFEEALGGPSSSSLGFYAATAHYADLTDGVNGRKGALGMQLAQQGLPRVLRGTTGDFNVDGDVDGADFLTWQRNFGYAENPAAPATRAMGNADGDDNPDNNILNRDVDGDDFNIWQAVYGFDVDGAPYNGFYFKPQSYGVDNSNVLLGPALPGTIAQGDLIDKVYAQGQGTVSGNLVTRELEFTLPVTTAGNPESHRNMENIIQLQMAIDNSNNLGVNGGASSADQNAARAVTTGIELSVPLDQIGANATSGPIKVMAFINGGSHDYASNQFSGDGLWSPLVSGNNPGGDGFGNFTGALHSNVNSAAVNLGDYEGDQFVTVANPVVAAGSGVPEPTGAALLAVGLLALTRRKR